jgi:hypothetical protein
LANGAARFPPRLTGKMGTMTVPTISAEVPQPGLPESRLPEAPTGPPVPDPGPDPAPPDGPDVPEPSPPVQPDPGAPDALQPDPKGPETPDPNVE